MHYVNGRIYRKGKFENGYIGFEDGRIKSIGKRLESRSKSKLAASGLIIPTFYNNHVHLADSFLLGEFVDSSIKKLVGPKSGLKMQKLRNATDRKMINSTKQTLTQMIQTGTSAFIDFREMGVRGINILEKSIKGVPLNYLTMGRPDGLEADENELNEILARADGIGVSAISDWPKSALRKVADSAHEQKKLFALHASEAKREDIDKILKLAPDFLVHMIEATKEDLKLVGERKIPVVVCPCSNMFYGKYPDITAMVKSEIQVLLGTDNAMITPPDMLNEMSFAFRCAKLKGGISPGELMRIAFHNPRLLFEPGIDKDAEHFEVGKKANFIVLDIPELKSYAHPENLLCLGISSGRIKMISMENYIWRRLK